MHVEKYFSSFAVVLAVSLITGSGFGAEPLLRLYDMTPVSVTNPVVASVKECGIEIPLNELCAYMNLWLPPEKKSASLTKADKLQYLQQLLDDHLLLWDGYQKKLDHTPELEGQLDYTLRLDLEAALVHRELEQKAPRTDDEKEKVIDALEDRIFKAAEIHIVPEAYEELKTVANTTDGVEPDLLKLTDAQRNLVLVRYDGGTLSVGDCLETYYALPSGSRPDLQDPDEFPKIVRSALISPLMQAEGQKEGLASSVRVQTNLQLNRNVLTKMAMLTWFTRQGDAQRETPGWEDSAKQWYEIHKSRYSTRADGKKTSSFETNRQAIMNDYEEELVTRLRADEVRNLRQSHTILINDPLLENLSSNKTTIRSQHYENVDKKNGTAAGSDS